MAGNVKRMKTNFIVIHCSATNPDMNIGAAEIDAWHKQRGFDMIGYADVIRRDGKIEEGRDIDSIGAHVLGYNSISVGICLIGGVDKKNRPENNFTEEQFKAMRRLLRYYTTKYPKAVVVGHNELDHGKACPSFDVQAWLKSENMV